MELSSADHSADEAGVTDVTGLSGSMPSVLLVGSSYQQSVTLAVVVFASLIVPCAEGVPRGGMFGARFPPRPRGVTRL